VERLRAASGLLAAGGVLAGAGSEEVREDARQLQEDLDALDRAVSEGRLEEQRERIRSARQRVNRLERAAAELSGIPPQVIVSPLQQSYENRTGASYDLAVFYAPSVVALLIQHIAVTLGALSLVRERNLGAVEIFRVAPVTARQVLLGKYFGYLIFVAIIVALLAVLMTLLGIPFLGSWYTFAGVALLLTLAALGVGFVISAISRTDSQAIQLSMLVLLLSIFFGGFFLPLENFWEPVRAVSYGLPLTHGIIGFQDVLLRGDAPGATTWAGLGIIAGVTFLWALTALWLELRRS
jgi:ABC-2 type transport system permease protein